MRTFVLNGRIKGLERSPFSSTLADYWPTTVLIEPLADER
jgi:hypothetical protein